MDKVRLFRLAFAWLPRLPRGLLLGMAVVIGWITWAVAGSMRQRVQRNLAHLPTLAANPQRLRRVVRQSFVHLVLNYIDLFAPPAEQNPRQFVADFPVQRGELLAETLRQGKGCIILAMHSDAFEAARYRIAGLAGDRQVIIPVEAIEPPELFELMQHQRERSGIAYLPVNDSATLRAMIATLRAGNAVLLALDRDVLQSGPVLPFFGAPSRFPTGPVALARLTGAPIIFAFPWREGWGRYRGFLATSPITIDGSTRGEEAVRLALAGLVQVLERQILAQPEQWLAAFASDVWDVAAEDEADPPHSPRPTAVEQESGGVRSSLP